MIAASTTLEAQYSAKSRNYKVCKCFRAKCTRFSSHASLKVSLPPFYCMPAVTSCDVITTITTTATTTTAAAAAAAATTNNNTIGSH